MSKTWTNHEEPAALLLAAGLGTRLQPLTDILPKCLMPIQGFPLLFYWLEQVRSLGFSQCFVNLHHHAYLVRQVIDSSPYAGWVQYLYEENLQGTAGTVRSGYHHFKGRPLWLIHADNLSAANWTDFMATYETQCLPGEMLMHTFTTEHPQGCDVVTLDAQHRVKQYFEKITNPPSSLANGAVYMLSPEVIAYLAREKHLRDFSTQVVPELIGQIKTWQTDGYHRNIGRWPAYVAAQREFSVSWKPQQSEGWLKLWQDTKFLRRWQRACSEAEKAHSGTTRLIGEVSLI